MNGHSHHTAITFRRVCAALRFKVRPETLALIGSFFFAALCNGPFWTAMLAGHSLNQPASWLYAGCLFVLLVALQFVLLTLLMYRWTAKPVLALLIVLTAAATYFMGNYGVYFDQSMLRNILGTDAHETRELLAPDMLPHLLLYAGLPLLLLSQIRLHIGPIRRDWWIRPTAIVAALVAAGCAMQPIAQQIVPKMREHRELRHLITPGNYIVSLAGLAARQHINNQPRLQIGLDAHKSVGAAGMTAEKPLLLLIVVGETVRAQNWGLNGYARATTPRLAVMDNLINFPDVTACGTNTEVSLPCMFSAEGHRHYNEQKIHRNESLLHVLNHGGIRVLWRDNQSGCKGVCEGLEAQSMRGRDDPDLCSADGCFDEILLRGLDTETAKTPGDLVVVLHQMGNHGPAYYLRYPDAFARFKPVCPTSELGSCTDEQIVNTYDNAILYTDHVLAQAIDFLRQQADKRRVALIYVSDHGESLGENGFYLHSLPYAIAPDTQTKVPMVMWLPDFSGSDAKTVTGAGGNSRADCLRLRAAEPASHDNLFHTVLGLAGVETILHEPAMDLLQGCRQPL